MVTKSTHEEFKREFFAPVMKSAEGKYLAVLSDNSMDRDGEVISKECIQKLGKDMGYVAGLLDHENKVLNQVAQWVNRKVEMIDGHTALIAEPKFFMSNPNAQIIKGMLDDGAQIGISIGAMIKDYDELEGVTTYKELELLEASFVAIPSNKHGRIMALAKSYKETKEDKMELTQKDLDNAVEKKAEEMKAEFSKQLEEKNSEIEKLKKDLEDAEKASEEAEEEAAEEKKKVEEKAEEAEKKVKELTEELEKVKNSALEKAKFTKGNAEPTEDVEKSFGEGKLPVIRI